MARTFKIDVDYEDGFKAKVFWHDNDTIEFITVPPQVQPKDVNQRTKLIEDVAVFCKTQKATKVTCEKVIVGADDA